MNDPNPPDIYYLININLQGDVTIREAYASQSSSQNSFNSWTPDLSGCIMTKTFNKSYNSKRKFNKSDSHYDKYKYKK